MGICSVEGQHIIFENKDNSKVGQIVHDLKTPIKALKSLINISEAPPASTEKKDIVQEAFERIDNLVDNLSNKRRFRLSFPLLPFVKKIVEIKKLELSGTSINLDLKWDATANDTALTMDQGELSRVIFNLLNNAQEAISQKGNILIRISAQTKYLTIDIHDNGSGIPPNCLPLVFKKNQSFSKKNGHGLGLFHAKRIIEESGGKIKIKSTLEKNTCVSLLIPLKKS